MARKNGLKNDSSSSLTFNSRTKAVMADVAQDNNVKEKVNSVREVVSGRSNNEIILVLQFYDYNVEKTIQAYLEDGAKEALQEWKQSGTKPVKKRKNKKKTLPSQPAELPKSSESVSSESGSAASFLANGDLSRDHVMNGVLDHDVNMNSSSKIILNGPTTQTYQASSSNKPTKSFTSAPPGSSNHYDVSLPNSTVTGNQSDSPRNQAKKSVKQSDTSRVEVKETVDVKVIQDLKATQGKGAKEKSPSPQPQRQNHPSHHNRHQTHSGPYVPGSHLPQADGGRDRTTSTSSTDGKSGKKHAHLGLERSAKDLHRQTVSLERLHLIFNEEIDRSYKRIKSVFDEIRTHLNAREALLVGEVNCLKETGGNTFTMRQGLAHDLKVQIDRAERMNEHELADLRVEIKHFVSDRKIDEDLAKTTRFLYDDKLKDDISVFGEVVPLKCPYIPPSTSSSIVSSPTVSEPSHHIPKPNIDVPVTSDKVKKPSPPHLAPGEAHEIAELQRRLKHSLTLEGIPVENYPERPATVPVQNNSTAKQDSSPRTAGSARRNNRNNRRRNDRNQPARQEGPKDDSRISINQAPNGDRVILIGRKTGPQGGSGGRPPRGGRGRGRGGGGRGRGGDSNIGRGSNIDRADSGNSPGDNTEQRNRGQNSVSAEGSSGQGSSPRKPLPQREGSGSPRRGSGRGRGQGQSSYSRRGNSNPGGAADSHTSPSKSASSPVESKQDG